MHHADIDAGVKSGQSCTEVADSQQVLITTHDKHSQQL